MDIYALHSALLSIVVLSKKLQSVREHLLMEDGTQSSALAEFLHEVERDLQVAKATLAGELGFALCPDQRDELAPKEESIVTMTQRAKRLLPNDAAHRKASQSSAQVLRHARCFSRGHYGAIGHRIIRRVAANE
jgi:hypothetical protein